MCRVSAWKSNSFKTLKIFLFFTKSTIIYPIYPNNAAEKAVIHMKHIRTTLKHPKKYRTKNFIQHKSTQKINIDILSRLSHCPFYDQSRADTRAQKCPSPCPSRISFKNDCLTLIIALSNRCLVSKCILRMYFLISTSDSEVHLVIQNFQKCQNYQNKWISNQFSIIFFCKITDSDMSGTSQITIIVNRLGQRLRQSWPICDRKTRCIRVSAFVKWKLAEHKSDGDFNTGIQPINHKFTRKRHRWVNKVINHINPFKTLVVVLFWRYTNNTIMTHNLWVNLWPTYLNALRKVSFKSILASDTRRVYDPQGWNYLPDRVTSCVNVASHACHQRH